MSVIRGSFEHVASACLLSRIKKVDRLVHGSFVYLRLSSNGIMGSMYINFYTVFEGYSNSPRKISTNIANDGRNVIDSACH